MKPSIAIDLKRAAVCEMASRFPAANPRIFGSVLHGTDHDGSDLDLLVDALPGATLFDLSGLHAELEELLGVPVDLLTPADLPPKFRDAVLAEARPVCARTACPQAELPPLNSRAATLSPAQAWAVGRVRRKRHSGAAARRPVLSGPVVQRPRRRWSAFRWRQHDRHGSR